MKSLRFIPRCLSAVVLPIAIASLCLPFALPGRAAAVINKFLAENGGGLRDEDLESPDWIEIYSSGPGPVNLGDWHPTDDAGALREWTFPATNLPAGGSLLVFASEKNRANAGLVTVGFAAPSSHSYPVQYNSTPGLTAWLQLKDVPAQPTNHPAVVVDNPNGAPQRWYRVVTPAQL